MNGPAIGNWNIADRRIDTCITHTHTHITCGIIKNHTTLLTYIIRSEYFRIDSACGCPYCVEMVWMGSVRDIIINYSNSWSLWWTHTYGVVNRAPTFCRFEFSSFFSSKYRILCKHSWESSSRYLANRCFTDRNQALFPRITSANRKHANQSACWHNVQIHQSTTILYDTALLKYCNETTLSTKTF